jgi:hypothetical protein
MSVTTHLHDLVNIKAETLTRDRGPFGDLAARVHVTLEQARAEK